MRSTEKWERIIELSPEAYNEIENKLIDAGYEFLIWPPNQGLKLDGFLICPKAK